MGYVIPLPGVVPNQPGITPYLALSNSTYQNLKLLFKSEFRILSFNKAFLDSPTKVWSLSPLKPHTGVNISPTAIFHFTSNYICDFGISLF